MPLELQRGDVVGEAGNDERHPPRATPSRAPRASFNGTVVLSKSSLGVHGEADVGGVRVLRRQRVQEVAEEPTLHADTRDS